MVPRTLEPAAAIDALLARFPALGDDAATPLSARFSRGDIVSADGSPWSASDIVGPGDELWFHRELRDEEVPPVDLEILYRDDHLLVLDKPHGMATMPRGAHVLASALVRLRRETGLSTLTPLHRLDRRTAGVLAFGIRPEERSAYQQLFARGDVTKVYEARVQAGPGSRLPVSPGARVTLRDRLDKRHGELTTRVIPGEVNAITEVEVVAAEPGDVVRLRMLPRTGRTHQLRAQLAFRGVPILGEDLYPEPQPEPELPLQLLARELAFYDPITGRDHTFRSRQELRSARPAAGPSLR